MTSSTATSEPDRGPAVRFPPPLPFVLGFGLGALLDRFRPFPVRLPDTPLTGYTGLALVAAGLTLVFVGIITFRRHHTAVYPNRPARSLVTTGVYAHTRNPMYLGMTTAYLGGVLATGLLWSLLMLPLVLSTIITLVISREEQHLMEKFPDEFMAYSARVRRWV
jgi:protein-S-isoprenylcysteine O-methyltransferase Ste14